MRMWQVKNLPHVSALRPPGHAAVELELHIADIQVRMQLLPFIGHDVSFFVQVLNVLALRTPLTFNNNDGATYGTVLTRMDPFRIRVGIDYAWGGGDRRAQRLRESGSMY